MMIKKTLLAALLLAGGLPGLAQKKGETGQSQGIHAKDESPDERARHEARRMREVLQLSDEQVRGWENAAIERMSATAPLREKMRGSTTPEERHELKKKMRENKVAFDAKIASLLTPEQNTKLKEERVKREDMKGHRGHGRP